MLNMELPRNIPLQYPGRILYEIAVNVSGARLAAQCSGMDRSQLQNAYATYAANGTLDWQDEDAGDLLADEDAA